MTRVERPVAEDLARGVLSRVSGCAVRVAELNLTTAPPANETEMKTDVTLTLAARLFDEAIVCVTRYEIDAEPVEPISSQSDRWSIAIEMHGMWTLEPGPQLTEQNAQAFALAVGAMALHPYARSHIQAAVAAAGYSMFTLDVLQSLMVEGEDGLVDLDAVSGINVEK